MESAELSRVKNDLGIIQKAMGLHKPVLSEESTWFCFWLSINISIPPLFFLSMGIHPLVSFIGVIGTWIALSIVLMRHWVRDKTSIIMALPILCSLSLLVVPGLLGVSIPKLNVKFNLVVALYIICGYSILLVWLKTKDPVILGIAVPAFVLLVYIIILSRIHGPGISRLSYEFYLASTVLLMVVARLILKFTHLLRDALKNETN